MKVVLKIVVIMDVEIDMPTAKEISMRAYGFTAWPETHVRTPKAVDCRAYACILLEKEGLSRSQIAAEIGFADKSSASHAIKIFKEKNMTNHYPNEQDSEQRKKLRDILKTDELEGAPETIWAWPHWDERNWYAGGCSTEVNLGMLGKQADEQTQYTRKDISDKRIAELEAALLEAMEWNWIDEDMPKEVIKDTLRALKADTT